MLEVEVLGASLLEDGLVAQDVQRLCEAVAARLGVDTGHVAVEFVAERSIASVNERHRGIAAPTDVLSFPVDGGEARGPAVELGDMIICPALTRDVPEAVIHGMLHLLGMDHESDGGEMLALQDELLAELRP
jgi:probable rRNA maturation factor